MAGTSRAQGGWYMYRQIRVMHPGAISWSSFEDPWTFHKFFLQDKLIWIRPEVADKSKLSNVYMCLKAYKMESCVN